MNLKISLFRLRIFHASRKEPPAPGVKRIIYPRLARMTLNFPRLRQAMLLVLSTIGIGGLVIGTFAAAAADVFPRYRAMLKEWGGGLLIASVALLGLAFPLI